MEYFTWQSCLKQNWNLKSKFSIFHITNWATIHPYMLSNSRHKIFFFLNLIEMVEITNYQTHNFNFNIYILIFYPHVFPSECESFFFLLGTKTRPYMKYLSLIPLTLSLFSFKVFHMSNWFTIFLLICRHLQKWRTIWCFCRPSPSKAVIFLWGKGNELE